MIPRGYHIQSITIAEQEVIRCDVWAVTGATIGLVVQFIGGRDNLILNGADAETFLDWWMNPQKHSIDNAQRVPFLAWDLIGKQIVRVVHESYALYTLADGSKASKLDITRNIPQTELEEFAAQENADFADERNTQEDALA